MAHKTTHTTTHKTMRAVLLSMLVGALGGCALEVSDEDDAIGMQIYEVGLPTGGRASFYDGDGNRIGNFHNTDGDESWNVNDTRLGQCESTDVTCEPGPPKCVVIVCRKTTGEEKVTTTYKFCDDGTGSIALSDRESIEKITWNEEKKTSSSPLSTSVVTAAE